MTVIGDCKAEGTIRIEGRVEGDVKAGKVVVIGKSGVVCGNIFTPEAVISGHVKGNLAITSQLELQTSSSIEGDIDARRIGLREGAMVNGAIRMGRQGQPL